MQCLQSELSDCKEKIDQLQVENKLQEVCSKFEDVETYSYILPYIDATGQK